MLVLVLKSVDVNIYITAFFGWMDVTDGMNGSAVQVGG
jgi:hypothetical protein